MLYRFLINHSLNTSFQGQPDFIKKVSDPLCGNKTVLNGFIRTHFKAKSAKFTVVFYRVVIIGIY